MCDVCDCQIPHQSLLELVRTVGHIHSKFRGACTTGDIRRLLDIVGPLALYPGEEERNTPGLERRHEGLCGHISITLTVTPPHWAADCSTISQQPLPKS